LCWFTDRIVFGFGVVFCGPLSTYAITRAGVIPALVRGLSATAHPELQVNSAWAIRNMLYATVDAEAADCKKQVLASLTWSVAHQSDRLSLGLPVVSLPGASDGTAVTAHCSSRSEGCQARGGGAQLQPAADVDLWLSGSAGLVCVGGNHKSFVHTRCGWLAHGNRSN
jgi:hypothetical protein